MKKMIFSALLTISTTFAVSAYAEEASQKTLFDLFKYDHTNTQSLNLAHSCDAALPSDQSCQNNEPGKHALNAPVGSMFFMSLH